MPFIVNGPNEETLLNCLTRVIKETTGRNEQRAFYALTCYFDMKSIRRLAARIKRALKKANGQLTGFYVVVDAGDWIKNRVSIEDVISTIHKITELPVDKIRFTPVRIPGKLLHTKGYGIISRSINGERRGFVAITSANMTKKGLGIDDNSNIELVEIITKPATLREFVNLIYDLEDLPVNTDEQDEFLNALKIFSSGCFYHKWDGNFSPVRFKLTLTQYGKEERRRNEVMFAGYNIDADTISKDPLKLQSIFEEIPKPFPMSFWSTYSADTILGKWVPSGIAELADELLDQNAELYIQEIQAITCQEKLNDIASQLEEEVQNFREKGYIKENVEVVQTWRDRVKRFRDNKEYIKTRIFNYEKIPNLLDSVERTIILQCYDSLKNRSQMIQPRGVKAVIMRAMDNGCLNLDEELQKLVKGATQMLKEIGNIKS